MFPWDIGPSHVNCEPTAQKPKSRASNGMAQDIVHVLTLFSKLNVQETLR